MYRLILTISTVLLSLSAMAQRDGYKIQVKMPGVKDSMAFLAHYFGEPLPKIYKADSARFDKAGNLTFESKEKTVGGIYMILLSDRQTYFEFILNNGDDMTITADITNLPQGLKFKNSPQNEDFISYMAFLKGFGEKQQVILDELKTAKTKADSTAIGKKAAERAKELTKYRQDYINKNPNSFLANIFNALELPVVPEGEHRLPDGKIDSNFAYNYYKQHYWDKFNFSDDRLVYTPLYDSRLDEYFNKLVLPVEDSIEREADILLAKTKGSKELFRYTLWWLTRFVETSKVMGLDAVFVYLVENYYMKGDAYWLQPDDLQKYIDRAHKIAPNVIGNLAPEIKLPDINNKMHSLSEMNGKYTVLVFWSPDCGHCLKEIPALDSLYKADLKAKGVKMFGVITENDTTKWREAIQKHKMNDWVHVWDPKHTSRFRVDYDIYSTPVIYLLDDKRIIRGKRLDHSNIAEVIDMLERKKKNETSKK
jgi:peroxiredoxin